MPKKKTNPYKNIVFTVGVLLIATLGIYIYLSVTSENSSQIEDAKQKLGIETKNTGNLITKDSKVEDDNENKDEAEKNRDGFDKIEEEQQAQRTTTTKINYLTDTKLLSFDNFDIQAIADREIEITGKTLEKTDKIIVNFSNNDSKFPSDIFELKKFKSGDEAFLYRAFAKYETIDYGKNVYLFEAFSGDKVSKVEVIIDLVRPEERTINIEDATLPVGDDIGNPVSLGDGKISYSDIRGLEVEKIGINEYACDKETTSGEYRVSELLDEKINGYYWWNTCRPLSNNAGMTFFVTRIVGTGYVYEKHYVTPTGYYGIYELEAGEDLILGDDNAAAKTEKLKQKNNELKQNNDSFENMSRVDDLFKKLAQ